jgi:hypothetical protein
MRTRSWIVGSLIFLGGSRAWGADSTAKEEAKRAFSAGVILLKDPDGAKYEEALAQFDKAYRLSGSWKVLGNIGLCSLKLERDGEAITAYEKYLTEGGKEIDADERAQVERDISALKAQVVHLHVELPPGATRLFDDRTSAQGTHVVNEYAFGAPAADLGLHPGRHALSVRLATGEVKWDVNLEPSATASHRFEPAASPHAPESPPPSRGSLAPGLVVGGLGAVGVGVGAVFGLKAMSNKNDSDGHCVGTSCDPTGLDLRHDAKSAATISNVAFAAGVAGVAVGAYLVLSRGSAGGKPATAWALGSSVAAGRAGLELRGDF